MKDIAKPNSAPPALKRRVPRWVIIFTVCVLTLVLLGVGRHFYLGWKERRLIKYARFHLECDNTPALQVTLDQVLQLNPNNLEAFRISGRALLKKKDSKAMPWLRRAVELSPETLDDRIALMEGALQFGQNQEALKVLRDIESKAQARADFQDLAGRVLQNVGMQPEAEAHYAKAVELAPGVASYRMHLATMRLGSPDPAIREKAREEIARLAPESSLRAVALRAMVVDAVRNMQTNRAVELVRELNALPNRLFSDRLMFLEVLHLVNAADFHERLVEVQEDAERNPENLLTLLYWMNGNNLALLARDWAEHLPKTLTALIPIRIEIARTYIVFGDWKKLRFFLADENWGDLDFLRRAFLARSNRELENNDANFKAMWMESINATANGGDALLMLARTALQWGWDTEASDALWQAVLKSNRSSEALNALCEFYYSKRDTAGLYRAYALLVDRNPTNLSARNNLAIFCLLLNKEKDRALNISRELHQREPANPSFASTYAFALYCFNENDKALEVMRALKPQDLKGPSVAAYYSAMLVAAGRSDEAQPYREIAREAALLPEEEQALDLVPPPDAKKVETSPPVQAMPTPAASEPPVQPTPTPAASEPPVQPPPTPAASEPPVQATPTPAASELPVKPTPTPSF